MVQIYTNTSCDGLKIVGVATDRCHTVKGSTVRVYFRLSQGPPVGWPSIFGVIWQVIQHPLKLNAGVEEEFVWIECEPDKISPIHLKRLNAAVAQTNAKYQQGAVEKAVNLRREAQLDAAVQARLESLDRALFPRDVAGKPIAGTPTASAGGITAKLSRFFRRHKLPGT